MLGSGFDVRDVLVGLRALQDPDPDFYLARFVRSLESGRPLRAVDHSEGLFFTIAAGSPEARERVARLLALDSDEVRMLVDRYRDVFHALRREDDADFANDG